MNKLFIDIMYLYLMNQPFIIKLPKVENKNLEFKNDKILFSPTINYPIITLGFHHYIKHTRKNFQKIIKNVTLKLQMFLSSNILCFLAENIIVALILYHFWPLTAGSNS